MTNPEFDNEFDILYNNLASNQAPPLDAYEKSVVLTLAEEKLIQNYYQGTNAVGKGFEESEELRRYLSTLVKTATKQPEQNTDGKVIASDMSYVFTLPDHLWFITYERAKYNTNSEDACSSGKEAMVTPVTQDDLQKILENPFKGLNLKRVLRLDIGGNQVELISKYKITDYTVRYIEYISPIVLYDLPTGITINGKNTATTCNFPEGLHRTILELAVEIAIAKYKKA